MSESNTQQPGLAYLALETPIATAFPDGLHGNPARAKLEANEYAAIDRAVDAVMSRDSSTAMLGSEALLTSVEPEVSTFGRMMAGLGNSRLGRPVAAGTLVAAGFGGGMLALESNAAAANYEQGTTSAVGNILPGQDLLADETATPTPTPTPTQTASPTVAPTAALAVTPVNDRYDLYAGAKYVIVNPMENDTLDPNTAMDVILATKICAISPSDGVVKLEKDINPHLVDISIKRGSTGIHHNTVTYCNDVEGTSTSFDLAVNVLSVHKAVIKKLTEMKHQFHMIKVWNKNRIGMMFVSDLATKFIPPHGARKVPVPNISTYRVSLPEENVRAGGGHVFFKN